MNYLAHATLAEPSDEARLGAILGDFARGLDEAALPADVCGSDESEQLYLAVPEGGILPLALHQGKVLPARGAAHAEPDQSPDTDGSRT